MNRTAAVNGAKPLNMASMIALFLDGQCSGNALFGALVVGQL
jgi:hypothetical protein